FLTSPPLPDSYTLSLHDALPIYDGRVTDPELMSIGAFAERAGMTASALRFYDDAGLLRPDRVDPVTGYRRYSEAQVARADRLRRDRKSTRLNSSHVKISYAVFCL